MPNNELQELLSTRFKEHTHPTNEAVWSAIEAQLDEEQKDRPGIWFWFMNGAAILVLCSAMIWNPSAVDSKTSTVAELDELDHELTSSEESVDLLNENASLELTQIDESRSKTPVNADCKQLQWTGSQVTEANWPPSYFGDAPTEFGFSPNPFPEFVIVRGEDENRAFNEENDNTVDQLSLLSLNNQQSNTIQRDPQLIVCGTRRNWLTNLPIHLGVEFTYMQRTGSIPGIPNVIDTMNTAMNDQLAFNRHFEVSAFSQFDLTRRFSASVGVGYSNAFIKVDSDTIVNIYSSVSTPKKQSEMHLITIPIQASYHVIRKNRFALSAGITFQTEIGNVKHTIANADQNGTLTTSELVDQSAVMKKHTIRQFAFEPFLQTSFNLTPRMSLYSNVGYRMYLNQSNMYVATTSRLNYYTANVGLVVRIK